MLNFMAQAVESALNVFAPVNLDFRNIVISPEGVTSTRDASRHRPWRRIANDASRRTNSPVSGQPVMGEYGLIKSNAGTAN